MAKISRQEVLDIARVSNLDIQPNEIDSLLKQLEQVLSYTERVKEVAHVHIIQSKNCNVFREDTIGAHNAEILLEQAPEREGDFFVVPLILESSDKKDSIGGEI